jgi:hypothetical protein
MGSSKGKQGWRVKGSMYLLSYISLTQATDIQELPPFTRSGLHFPAKHSPIPPVIDIPLASGGDRNKEDYIICYNKMVIIVISIISIRQLQ